MMNTRVVIGLAGFGTIGTGVVKTIQEKAQLLKDRTGYDFEIARIADLDLKRDRGIKVPASVLTDDIDRLLDDDAIDVFVELIGGVHPAREFIVKAMQKGKSVVTANKALLASHGAELFRIADEHGVYLGFEASVGGGIPIINALTNSLVANRFLSISAIINGTSNYILSKMTSGGGEFEDVLAEARAHGYAEANPSLDVDGIDAAHKLTILLVLAYGGQVPVKDVYVEGVRDITQLDIKFADELGYVIKQLAIAKAEGHLSAETHKHSGVQAHAVSARVHPAMVAKGSIMSMINDVYNGIHVVGDAIGSQLFIGKGAGMMPTASAVVGDIVEISKKLKQKGTVVPGGSGQGIYKSHPFLSGQRDGQGPRQELLITDIGHIRTSYYLRFTVLDKPGVLAGITKVLGMHDISIESVIQKGRSAEKFVPVVIMTHDAAEENMRKALDIIDRLSVVKEKTKLIRIEKEVI